MVLVEILSLLNLLGAGVLAGEELVIRYGVSGPLASLDQRSQIRLRQALIRRLRILVPAVFALTILCAIARAVIAGGAGSPFRWAAIAALIVFISITLGGTVPINQAALTWDAATPPENWRALVRRWERLDTARTWAALIAFGLFLAAAGR